MKRKRELWLAELHCLDPEQLVFLDESGAKTNMTRLRGRAKGGSRLYSSAPHGHWCTTTIISSIRLNGKTASMEIGSATDAVIFREYVRQVLVPTLQSGDIVIMDNLRAHYDTDSISMIEQTGASVKFLPPYSPDFNPIEKMWSKVKEKLRGIGARTQEELSEAIAVALSTVSSQDAEGWFYSCHITASQS